MIQCNLSRLMGERKLRVADVVHNTGLPRSTITALWKGTAARIELSALSTLCQYLQCSVGDLLEFQPVLSDAPDIVRKKKAAGIAPEAIEDNEEQRASVEGSGESDKWFFKTENKIPDR